MTADVVNFPQKQANEFSSLMSLLSCDDCHAEWIGLYETGRTVDELDCPYCNSTRLTNRQGEREVFFYEYDPAGHESDTD